MGEKKMFNKLLDWASNKVQKFTGETERRQLVQQFKDTYENFRYIISEIIDRINLVIGEFNAKIEELNEYRNTKVKNNIKYLGIFLGQFGNLKKVGDFALEEKQVQVELPQKQFEIVEDYISDIDWSKGDVFSKTFFKGVIGVRFETRKLNAETTSKLHEFELAGNRAIELAELNYEYIKQDIEILGLYQDSVKAISDTIEEKIIPEMQLVQAFLQCDQIKNQILANNDISVKEENDISLLAGTKYNKHYEFIKNTFMFFVISSKIYNTPVLTNLLTNEQHEKEYQRVLNYIEVLEEQQKKLSAYAIK